ncbi:MAG TPA: LuxR C-terminal-related transcriptional regulator [Gaiellaceae bacterium]
MTSERKSARQRGGRPELAASELPFDFLESKIRAPVVRPEAVRRTGLVNRLRAATTVSVTTVVAPAGYGKTTLLAQWAERDGRRFAWVTLDARDNDPVVLLRHISAALEHDEALPQALIGALMTPGPSIWTAALPRLAEELARRGPIVLVLDDFNVLRSRESLETVRALIEDEVEGSMLVVAGRTSPRLPLARLRAGGMLLELVTPELAMTKREAQLLLRATGVRLSDARAAELVEQCEGWPAALYLAALSIRDGRQTGRDQTRLGGDDRYLADYFRSEYLSYLRPEGLAFLRRTSVLERMCGPLCSAVLQEEGAGEELEKIERANLFLVPLDNRRIWYRYHHLFRDLLQRELAEHEPGLLAELHGRAADWFQAYGDDESALEHAYAGGDLERSAPILARIVLLLYYSGRITTLERWLKRFDRPALLERHPEVALLGCGIHAARGRPKHAQRWLDAASRGRFRGKLPDGSPSIGVWAAVLRAWLCRNGAEPMLADAEAAVAELPEGSNMRPSALVAQGAALMLLADFEHADAVLAAASELAAAQGSIEAAVIAIAERSLIASELGDHKLADELAEEAQRLVTRNRVAGYPARALDSASTARRMIRHGRWNEARAALSAGQEVVPFLTVALPWLAVQVRLELARGLVTLRDADTAQQLLNEAQDLLQRVPGLDTLAAKAHELQREVDVMPAPTGARRVGLTPAELRLLPLLATHLSFREIAEQLYISRNTIKTQAISVYRKLGVSSRSAAIAEAQRLGLEDHLRVVVTDGSEVLSRFTQVGR